MLNPSSFSNDAKADMNAGRGNGNGKRQKQHGQGAQKKDQHLRAEQGTTQHEDYTPPMRNAVDATHNIPGSNQDSNKNPGARGEAPGAKASRPRRKKPRSKKAVAHASAQNTSPAAQSVLSASGETSHPARNHTIEAIMVLAQTLLAPHQMLELIKRLSSAMPANAAKPPFSIHPAAKHQDPQVSLDVSDAPGSTKQQGPRGEDAVRSRRGRGPSWARGGRGRGRGAWSRGRGGRGAGSL